LREFREHLLLQIAKSRLARTREELADAAAEALLDHVVGIKKRQPEPP
jgi:hypothetical protein